MSTPYLDARYLAAAKHASQRYGVLPYMDHLEDVFQIVLHMPDVTEDMKCAAYLHDILEDTDVTSETIEKKFGERVMFLVHFCTDEKGKNRDERKFHTNMRNARYIKYLPKKLVKEAIGVKLADRVANVRFSIRTSNERVLRRYWQEHGQFMTALDSTASVRFNWERWYPMYWQELDDAFRGFNLRRDLGGKR